jgi:hypothetical protein
MRRRQLDIASARVGDRSTTREHDDDPGIIKK